MIATIYHNPRCTKSRETLALLEKKGITPNIIEYLHTPPTAKELAHILKLLNITPRELIRKNEIEYKERHLDNPNLTDSQLIASMVAFPKLIERPIVLANGKARIGRPPENIMDIL